MTSTLTSSLRVTEREFRFFINTWKGTVFTTFVGPLLMLVAIGVGLGGFVAEDAELGGVEYLRFITPGLVVAAAAQQASGMSLWPVMAGHRWIGFHRAVVATPISAGAIATGYLLWIVIKVLIQAVVFLSVAALFGGVGSGWAVLAVPIVGLTAAGFAAPIMGYAATCDSDRAFDPILRIVVVPLFLFSGTFFPSSQLPAAVEWLARLFPLWHGVELSRWLVSGVHPAWPPLINLAVLLAWVGPGLGYARRRFTARLSP